MYDRLHASCDAEPTFRALDVVVDSSLTDAEELTDNPIALALGHELQALPLTIAKLDQAVFSLLHDTDRGVIQAIRHQLHDVITRGLEHERIRHDRTGR